jgi:hypothetical protein
MAPKPKRPDYTGSLASYKQSVADKPKGLDLPSPSDVVNWASGIVAAGRMAAGQTQAVTPGDKGVRTMGQGISMANNMLNPYSNTTKKLLGFAVNQDRKSLNALSKSAAVDALVTGAAIGVGKVVGKSAQAISNAYQEAKSTVKVNNVLIHGGANVLEGGVINPKFVQGNSVALNEQQLNNANSIISRMQKNVNFTKEQVKLPGSYANNNLKKSLAQIAEGEKAITDTQKWVDIAKRENYFTAVDDAQGAYGFKGSYHVVKPPKQNVSVQFGPSGEYQVAGSQKPVKSFSTVGKTVSEQSDIAKEVNAYAERLRQQQIKKEAIKQTLKNLRK